MRIRPEQPDDRAAIHAVNAAAFSTPLEADLVDALRAQADPFLSLVALVDTSDDEGAVAVARAAASENASAVASAAASAAASEDATVAGHILFTPVTLSTDPTLRIMGLAPMAVAPAHQRHGVGSALIREGIARCRAIGAVAIVVLGHPTYYPRFGFTPASRFGLACEYEAPDEAFMAMELEPGALRGKSGMIRYHAAFAAVE